MLSRHTAASNPAQAKAIGSRSQSKRALSGVKWYQPEPRVVSTSDPKNKTKP
jgi:hypothetical protein